MVLKILATVVAAAPSKYYAPTIVGFIMLYIIKAFTQGRSTTRDRDLHARVVLVTGGFTPMGMTLINQLAQRGAHIIALSPHPIESPEISILVDLLRTSTKNEQIFAEECDLTSPQSIRSFCTRFLTGQEQRLDAIVFAHEYQHIGSLFKSLLDEKRRCEASLATFLVITLLLPALLVAPVERDIRVINVVNRFYAAAVPSFSPTNKQQSPLSSIFLSEGTRSLRMVVLTRHLQRVLDALPSAQIPNTEDSTIPVVSEKAQRSNIVAVSVSPGISRSDTISPLLGADTAFNLGFFLYILFQPLLRIFTKSPIAALQSVLHVLFLPTPFKSVGSKTSRNEVDASPQEILKPGSLYSDCAIVNINLPTIDEPKEELEGEGVKIPDDGELGGEVTGRLVWESFEEDLKEWEKANPSKLKDKNEGTSTSTDQ